MSKELGSKLANSVRQAKAKQTPENTLRADHSTEQFAESSKPKHQPKYEQRLPVFTSKRVWPD